MAVKELETVRADLDVVPENETSSGPLGKNCHVQGGCGWWIVGDFSQRYNASEAPELSQELLDASS